ncbi:MAG: SDR family NAD(P)-dependent oxidoreductase [Psychromonas sp.]|nr:SDR family NAD(P)-dependent oxidoreductase [Psychromonas sp.]
MKRVLITGATSGIGKALAVDYASQGWKVVACGRNQPILDELVEHKNITTLCFDITDKQQIADATDTLDNLDLLILNAGNCEYIDDPKHFDSALFERVITTNLLALGYCLDVLLSKLSPGGQLALMGSSASYLPFPRAEAYGSSKAAVAYLAKSLAIDLLPEKINVSLICPGFVKTPLTDKNDFKMPLLITAEQAADYIVTGLQKGKKEIHFPRKFTYLLKLFAYLPGFIWQKIATRSTQK